VKTAAKHGNFQIFLLNFEGSFHSFSLCYNIGTQGLPLLIFNPQIKVIGYRYSVK